MTSHPEGTCPQLHLTARALSVRAVIFWQFCEEALVSPKQAAGHNEWTSGQGMTELPEYYFRIRENGAAVFRISTDNRQRRIEMEEIAIVNIRNGNIRPHG